MSAADSSADHSRDFVALMRCDAGDGWFPDAFAQIQAWLREKKFDVDLSGPADLASATGTVTVRSLPGSGDGFRIRLVEPTKLGTWTTDLVLHDEPGPNDWISLVVRNSNGRVVNVPRLARYLMQVLPLGDGAIEFADSPQVFGVADIERLTRLLTDRARHGLVFVAGTDDKLSFGAFRRQLAKWTKEVYGLGQVVILDPAATRALEERVGPRFAAPAWTIRTYQPGATFTDALDARRHRILGTARLAKQHDGATLQLLSEIARQHAATRPADPAVQRVLRRFERLENRRLVEEVSRTTHVPEPSPEHEAATESSSRDDAKHDEINDDTALLQLVRRTLGIETITEESLVDAMAARVDHSALNALERRIDDLQSEKEQLQDEHSQLLEALDEAQVEIEVANIDLDNRASKIAWLESRLKRYDDYEATYLPVPEKFATERPDSFKELLDWLEEIEEVCFTGDRTEVEKLHQIDTNNAALRTAWDAVLAMQDYARSRAAGDWNNGLDQYLRCPPDGYRAIAAGKFGASETAATMKAYGHERIFPVPASVHQSERIAMKAHFKLAQIGMTSPRMYLLDRHPNDPHLYIGYIGPHLTNTQTR